MTKREYMRQVGRHLQCVRAKRREILRQLDSHIEIALGEGRELEAVLADMGEPVALAEEFNESLEERERRRKSGVWQAVSIVAGAAAVLAFLAAAVYWRLPKAEKLEDSDVFDAAAVQARAEEAIRLFGAEEYGALEAMASGEMRAVLEKVSFPLARQSIGNGDWGALRSIGSFYLAEIRERGQRYAVAQVNVSYESASVTFTLSFNRQMELYGFYIK